MVDRLQIVAEIIRAEPSQERHECLKRPEENSHAYRNTKMKRRMITPLTIDTAKQSIAKASDRRQMSNRLIIIDS